MFACQLSSMLIICLLQFFNTMILSGFLISFVMASILLMKIEVNNGIPSFNMCLKLEWQCFLKNNFKISKLMLLCLFTRINRFIYSLVNIMNKQKIYHIIPWKCQIAQETSIRNLRRICKCIFQEKLPNLNRSILKVALLFLNIVGVFLLALLINFSLKVWDHLILFWSFTILFNILPESFPPRSRWAHK